MIQRFQMAVFPDTVPYKFVDKPNDRSARDQAFQLFEKLHSSLSLLAGQTAEIDGKRFVSFDPEAELLFEDWINGQYAGLVKTS